MCANPSNNEKPRVYGTDSTDDLETMVEGEIEEDGSLTLTSVVIVEKEAEDD